MKQIIRIVFLLLVVAIAFPNEAQAQRKKKKSSKSESSFDLKRDLWYGGGFNLGFGSTQFQSSFLIGASPMVGYKITPWLSFGPRLDFFYQRLSFQTGPNTVDKYDLYSYGIGPFLRAKTNFKVFGHFEYQTRFIDNPDNLSNLYFEKEALNLGLGYNDTDPRGVWGYEIYVLYNVLAPENSIQIPIDIRFGITYNF